MKTTEPTPREVEMRKLELAIKNTEAAQCRAVESLYRLHIKRERQQAELLLQKLLATLCRKLPATPSISQL